MDAGNVLLLAGVLGTSTYAVMQLWMLLRNCSIAGRLSAAVPLVIMAPMCYSVWIERDMYKLLPAAFFSMLAIFYLTVVFAATSKNRNSRVS
jgi:hypothetical protein